MKNITVYGRVVVATLLLLACAATAHADIYINKAILEFSPSTSSQTLLVGNAGDEPVYVITELTEVLDPASATPQTRRYDDVRRAPVIANPQTLLLQPGQRKIVRVFLKDSETDVDRVYKLKVKPYIEELAVNRPVSAGSRSAIKVSVGYNVLLLHRPQGAAPDVEVTRQGSDITFTNKGNTNVLLKDVRQCTVDGEATEENCALLGINRLYVGESWRVRLPHANTEDGYPVRARFITHDKAEDREFY